MNARLRRLPERFEPEKYEQRVRPGGATGESDAPDEAEPDGSEPTQRPV